MRRSELYYDLPPDRIAQQPIEPRDSARLLVLQRKSGQVEHRRVRDLLEYLRQGDCLVLNNTRVLPARFFCRRVSGGGVEALFLSESDAGWRVLLKPSNRLRVGELLEILPVSASAASAGRLNLLARHERGEWLVQPEPRRPSIEILAAAGQVPLPPYIRRASGPSATDGERYQTVFASRDGSIAAPTAGLHFTPELLAGLEQLGVHRAEVTLHVGLGTFATIDAEDLAGHVMHRESYELSATTAEAINATKEEGGRVVAVGTTSTRVLESLPAGPLLAARGETQMFIYPPYRFSRVDALLTNFHLPESTLLALVMAFAGREFILRAYAEAIATHYRFFSYGDAMLIL